MAEPFFDRIARILTGIAPRRDAVKAMAASGLATVTTRREDAAAKSHHRKRCRKRGESCGGKKKCCNKPDRVKCGRPTPACEERGKHCCGTEGASCHKTESNNSGACECCEGMVCVPEGKTFRCKPEGT
jgi:hypothetical protein